MLRDNGDDIGVVIWSFDEWPLPSTGYATN